VPVLHELCRLLNGAQGWALAPSFAGQPGHEPASLPFDLPAAAAFPTLAARRRSELAPPCSPRADDVPARRARLRAQFQWARREEVRGEGRGRRKQEEERKKKRKRRKGSALKKEGVRGELEGRSESKPRRAGPIAEREHGPDGRTTWATAGTREHGWPNARLVGGFDWPDHSWASSWVHDGGGDQP